MTKEEALKNFLDVWTNGILLREIGPTLTCLEARVLAELLIACDKPRAALNLVEGHLASEGEEPEEAESHQAMLTALRKEDHEEKT